MIFLLGAVDGYEEQPDAIKRKRAEYDQHEDVSNAQSEGRVGLH